MTEWLQAVPNEDLETLWTILYLGADSPGVLPVWATRSVELWHEVDAEVQRRRGAESNPAR